MEILVVVAALGAGGCPQDRPPLGAPSSAARSTTLSRHQVKHSKRHEALASTFRGRPRSCGRQDNCRPGALQQRGGAASAPPHDSEICGDGAAPARSRRRRQPAQ
jgi:hypothetical protein